MSAAPDLQDSAALEVNLDVVLCRVGIGADDMRLRDQIIRHIGLDPRQRYCERRFDPESLAVRARADADLGVDSRLGGDLDLFFASDGFQGAQKASRITGREQLLRVDPVATRAAQFFGCDQINVQRTILRA